MKKIVLLLGLLGAVGLAQADYLHWLVGGTDGSNLVDFMTKSADFDSSAYLVTLKATTGDVQDARALNLGEMASVDDYMVIDKAEAYHLDVDLAGLGDGLDAYKFFVELYWTEDGGESFANKAISDMTSYADLLASGAVTRELSPVASLYIAQAYAVPEPTSGVLMLLGLAAFGLRRRRRSI